MANKLNDSEKEEVQKRSGGKILNDLTTDLVDSLNPDRHVEQAKETNKNEQPDQQQIQKAAIR